MELIMDLTKILRILYIVLFFGVTTNTLFAETTSNGLTPEALDEGVPETSNSAPNPPFGSNLFAGSFNAKSASALDPDYIISPGDKVSLHIWGAVQADEITTVDAQGNIFLPDIGAVNVAGSPAKNLEAIVTSKLRSVYKEGVDVYVNLDTSTPINVFVTGPVPKPGQYSGMQNDSILAFLHRAGGIHPTRGSYRNIFILRKGKRIAKVDLYAFLRWGQLPRVRFQTGDTILVAEQNATVSVLGDARGNYSFELVGQSGIGRDLITFTRPYRSVTNVAISGTRNKRPWTAYLPISKFSQTSLNDGDNIRFTSDAQPDTLDITVQGSYLGNSFYAAKKGTRLLELLDYIAVSPDEADISNIYILRKSVAEKQKKNLEESISRLERSILTSPAKSDGEADIRRQEAALVGEFIKNARNVVPTGRVVVSENGNVANIRLEDGDTIVIPFMSDVVTVSGEVNIPQAIVFASNALLNDYIDRSGGYTERAEKRRLMIRKPNGKILNTTSQQAQLSPGDEIIVLPRVDTKSLQNAKDIMTIIFQIAAASKAVGIL